MFVVERGFVPAKPYRETLHGKQMKAEWIRLKLEWGGWAGRGWVFPAPLPHPQQAGPCADSAGIRSHPAGDSGGYLGSLRGW